MSLTEEERKEIAAAVAENVKSSGLLDLKERFTPGDKEIVDPLKDKMGLSPEEKIMADKTGGFRDLGEFACAIAGKGSKWYGNAHFDKLAVYSNAVMRTGGEAIFKTAGHMEEGDMAQGGYLVPEEFRAQLLMTTLENSIVKQRSTVIPMQTNRIGIPAVVDSNHTTSYFGGVNVYRTAESAAKTETKPALDKVYLTLHKLTGLVYVSDELLEDSPMSLVPILNTMFGMAIGFEEDDDYLVGNGVGRPLGAFNAGNPCLVVQAIEAGQPINTIVWQNIARMWSRLHPSSMRNAVWIANNECFPQLATMSMAVGVGGVPVWLPANGAADTPFGTLMGRPLILTEKMQALSTQGDIGVGDFSQYLVAEKAGGSLKTATSIHLRFNYDEQTFRWVLRYDGQPWWLSALTPKRGVATLSPFVVLAVRP